MITETFQILRSLNRLESKVIGAIHERNQLLGSDWAPITLRELEPKANTSHVTLIKVLRSLKTRHLVEVQFRKHRNKGNIYRLRIPGLNTEEARAILEGKPIPPKEHEVQSLIFETWVQIAKDEYLSRVQGASPWAFDPENYREFFCLNVWSGIKEQYSKAQLEEFYWQIRQQLPPDFLSKLRTPMGPSGQSAEIHS